MRHVREVRTVEVDPIETRDLRDARIERPARQAYGLMHMLFVVLPTVAGLDKFFHLLTNWDKYLSPQVAHFVSQHTGLGAHDLMRVVGGIEIAAGLLVAVAPRIGAWIVGAWLLGIIANLALMGGYYDIIARDAGLAIAAFSLARLASRFRHARRVERIERGHVHVRPITEQPV